MKPDEKEGFCYHRDFFWAVLFSFRIKKEQLFPPGCAVVSKNNRCSVRKHQTLLLFPFSLCCPFFCVLPPPLGLYSSYFPSAVIFPLTSAPIPPFLLGHMSHEGRSDRGATVLWQSKRFSCPAPSHTVTRQMPAQMPAKSQTPFHLSLLKKFFVPWILSWDRVYFNPFVFLSVLISYGLNGKLASSRNLFQLREPLVKPHPSLG